MSTADHGPINDKDLEDCRVQVKNQRKDKDRMRILKANLGKHTLTCSQAVTFLTKAGYSMFDTSDGGIEAAELFFNAVSDKDNFQLVLNTFQYEDEKEILCRKVGIPYVPKEKK